MKKVLFVFFIGLLALLFIVPIVLHNVLHDIIKEIINAKKKPIKIVKQREGTYQGVIDMAFKTNRYNQEVMEAYNQAIKQPHDNHSSIFSSTAKKLTTEIKGGNYNSIMKFLDKLSLPQGFTLHVDDELDKNMLGDTCKLFVRTDKRVHDYNIWDYIHAENSIDGAWQAYFLYTIVHILPLWWHSNYMKRTYYYSYSDAEYVLSVFAEKEDIRRIQELGLSPEAVEINGKYYVSRCYWSQFGGLQQETVEVSISSKQKVSFKDINIKTLYEYNCGIRY